MFLEFDNICILFCLFSLLPPIRIYNWFPSRIQTVKIVLHLEFNDLMQIFTKNQQYADSGENGMVKIQIELQGVINILEENWKTSLAHRL